MDICTQVIRYAYKYDETNETDDADKGSTASACAKTAEEIDGNQ